MTNSHGFHTSDDVLTRTADGKDLNAIWGEYLDLLNAVNGQRQALISFLTFGVSNPVEQVVQPGGGVDFEEASEFGEPVGARLTPTYFNMGYSFKWYDLASRYTWQFLADAQSNQVDSVANAAVEAYYRLQLTQVLRTVFNPTNLSANIQGTAYNVYKFYNNDGTTPPTYKSNTFTSSHNHYVTSGNATLDSGDVEAIENDLVSHGYDPIQNGNRLVLMVNKAQGDVIRTWKLGVTNNNSAVAKYDFIPAVGYPGQLVTVDPSTQLIGAVRPANTLNGLPVIGNYGLFTVVQDDNMPSGYMFGFATGGEANLSNPVGVREHANASLRGLRLVKGRNPDYPLIDSFWAVGFGTGVRHRGGGFVMQVSASGSYTTPAAYA